MVRCIWTVCILWLVANASYAANHCIEGTDIKPRLCAFILPKITSITITENAAKSSAETDATVSCSSFRINQAKVRRYFRKTKLTTQSEAHSTLNWSPCYATGKMTFNDGRSADWMLDQFRSGAIIIKGEEKQVVYCPQCKFSPFIWWDEK